MPAPHRAARLARRTLGASVAAALLVAVLPASPGYAAGSLYVASTNDQPGATAAANTSSATLVLQASSAFLASPAPAPTVTFTRKGGTDDVITGTNVSVNAAARTISVTMPFTSANPDPYSITVTQSSPPSTITDSCTDCFTVVGPAPRPTSVTPSTVAQTGGSAFVVNGTGFARGNYDGDNANYNCGDCVEPPTVEFQRNGATVSTITISETRNANNTGDDPVQATATTITKVVSVAESAALGAYDVVVTNTDGERGVCAGCFTVAPAMTGSASPNRLGQGTQGGTITITGTNFPTDLTGTILDTTQSNQSNSGMSASFVRDSDTQARFVNVTVNADARLGDRVLNLYSSSVRDTLPIAFTVAGAPTATARTLRDGNTAKYGQGAEGVRLQVTGTNFVTGVNAAGTRIALSPATGITITSSQATSSTSVEAVLNIASDAPTGARTISVVNPDGGTAACSTPGSFPNGPTPCTLMISPAPKITTITPNQAGRGSTKTYTFSGTDLSDAEGGDSNSPPIITIGGVSGGTTSLKSDAKTTTAYYNDGTASQTAVGPKDVTLINTDTLGRTTCSSCFTITSLEVASDNRSNGFNTGTKTGVIVRGNGFDAEATVALVKTGLGSAIVPVIPGTVTTKPVNSAGNVDGTSLTASFDLTGADPGTYAFRVTNPASSGYPGTGQAGVFDVVASAPSISSVAPSSRGTGAVNETITLTGANFGKNPASVVFSNTGITLHSFERVSATQIRALISVAETASTGGGTVRVTNTDGQFTESAFTVVAGPKFSTTTPGISPNTRGAGTAPFNATVKGQPTTLPSSANAALLFSNPSVTATNVTVTPGSAGGLTSTATDDTLTASVTVAGGPAGPVNVILRDTSTGGRATCTGCFTVTASAPAAPTNVVATPGSGQATVTWTPGADNGAPITSYTVTSSPGGATSTVTGSPAGTTTTVTGLVNGTSYTFTVVARNSVGTSAASAPSAAVTPRTVPGAPVGLTATPGNGKVTLAWRTPSNGGSAITGYVVTTSPGSSASLPASATGYEATGLTNGTAYTFTVKAQNAVGDSAAAQVTSTPRTLPGKPTNVTATPGVRSASVSWTAPADGGATITSYVVTASPGGRTVTVTGNPAASQASFTGLASGATYTFTVVARNAAGTGPASDPSAPVQTPVVAPAAPSGVTAVPGNGEARVSWTAPENGGSPITSYRVTASPGGAFVTVTGAPPATSATVTGLTNGTAYTFAVTAANSVDDSAASAASAPVTPKYATKLTQSGGNATIRYGKVVTLSGALTTVANATEAAKPLAAAPVRITLAYDDRTTTVVSATTTSTGAWSYTFTPSKNASYTARYAGAANAQPATSTTRKILVAAVVGITSPANGSKSDNATALVVRGYVSPNKAGQYVTIYRVNANGTLSGLKAMRLSSSSTYAFNLGTTATGTFRYVVKIANTLHNLGGSSGVLTVYRT